MTKQVQSAGPGARRETAGDTDWPGAAGVGNGLIPARSPQAKGHIERFFETTQDRLVKGMRKQKVCTLEGANAYLEQTYLPLWNERFTVRPANEADAHRPLGKAYELACIL